MSFLPALGYQKNKHKSAIPPKSPGPLDAGQIFLTEMSRPVQKTSAYYFHLYKLVWRWAFVTLPIDFCFVLFLPLFAKDLLPPLFATELEQICILLLFVSSTWFFKNWTLIQLTGWNNTRGKVLNVIERNPILLILFLVLLVGTEIFLKIKRIDLWSILITSIVVLGALSSFRKNWKDRLLKQESLNKDLTKQVEAYNQKLFLIHLIPLLAARLAILISSLGFSLSTSIQPSFLLSLSAACVMLSIMQAEEKYFMISCSRCGSKTSRFLEQYAACLACIYNEKTRIEALKNASAIRTSILD